MNMNSNQKPDIEGKPVAQREGLRFFKNKQKRATFYGRDRNNWEIEKELESSELSLKKEAGGYCPCFPLSKMKNKILCIRKNKQQKRNPWKLKICFIL